MLPREVTLAVVDEELRAARNWADRRGIDLDWEPGPVRLRVVLIQPVSGEPFYLQGVFDAYRALPPSWDFRNEHWKDPDEKTNHPAPGRPPGIGSSIFHTHPVICAPFNRLAYKTHGGPHDNWGGPEQWLHVQGTVRADTIGDMLAVIARDLACSPGRME